MKTGRKLNDLNFWKKNFSKRYTPNLSGCWIWNSKNPELYRYGLGARLNGKQMGAHRLSYLLHHGEIPNGMLVCHRCDVGMCVNPDHLFLGSGKDNMLDAKNKGRTLKGSRHNLAKLSEKSVIIMRRLYADGIVSIRMLSRAVGMSKASIGAAVNGKTWKHV
jgi:hypothetical protein